MPVETLAQIGDHSLSNDDTQVVLTQPKQSAPNGKEDKAASEQKNELEVMLGNGGVDEFTDQQRWDQSYADPQNHHQCPKRELPAINTQRLPDLNQRARDIGFAFAQISNRTLLIPKRSHTSSHTSETTPARKCHRAFLQLFFSWPLITLDPLPVPTSTFILVYVR